jgi:hypothetical protein
MPRTRRNWLSALLATGVTLAAAVGAATAAQAAPADTTTTQDVPYLGYHFQVPGDWQVIDLAEHPDTCVRFDQHAVYLGTPGTEQDCPAHLTGRTGALLVQPGSASAAAGTTVNTTGAEIRATAPGIQVLGGFGTDQAVVSGIVASAGIPATAPAQPKRSQAAAGAGQAAAAAVAASTTDYTGQGFDACAAPSAAAMSAWKPTYSAVGIYIGGSQRGCAQPNLTSGWVSQQASAGWHFIPIYVGPQAKSGQITSAASQGKSAADDAVTQAQSLGFGGGSVLYYDMEGYSSSQRTAALGFLSAWTTEIHAKGFKSGVYSSAASGITDLVAQAGTGYAEPDVLYNAHWTGVATTDDSYIPDNLWANHQRVQQYDGSISETHGGVTINIDKDYLDVKVASATPSAATVTAPSAGDIVSGTVTLSAQVSDAASASFYVDGDLVGTDTAGSAGTYSAALDTTTLTEGEHTLTAKGTNSAGQTGAASAGVSFFVANRATAARTTGDFNGDGKDDIAVLYNYSNVDSALFTFTSTGSGFAAPVKNWESGEGNWNWDRTKLVTGDFNGDGKTDVGALYNYGNVDSALFTFTSTGTGFTDPVKVWESGEGNWNWDRTKLVSGDFTGDGKSDIAALYNYSNVDSGLFTFTSTGTGFSAPVKNWESGEGNWNWDRSKIVAGDFTGDGKADIAALYNYGNVDSAVWRFTSTGTGFSNPVKNWDSGEGGWNWDRSDLA